MTNLNGRQIDAAGLDGWAYLLLGLQTRIATPDYAAGVALAGAIGAAAGARGMHADVDLRRGSVDVRLQAPDAGRVTEREVELARALTAVAAEAGLTPDAAAVSRVELALDTPDGARVSPFWGAVLGYPGHDDEVRDPADALPVVWFQPSGSAEPRQRWHPDLWVDPGQVRLRIDAALAAGGTLVSDAEAPRFWVLADPDGNQVCLCTWQERTH